MPQKQRQYAPTSCFETFPVPECGIGAVRYSRLVPKDAASAKNLQKRTLTNLYNEHPTWLALAPQENWAPSSPPPTPGLGSSTVMKVSAEAVAALQKALPKCKIVGPAK